MVQSSKFEDHIHEGHFTVAIFGSARIKRDDKIYKKISGLAKMIAKEGMDIVTGGGPGLMEAANKGHREGRKNNDVHSVGLNIKLPKEQHPNGHLDVYKEFDKFSERLDHFMYLSDVVILAPGGIGTTLELFYTWQLTQVKHICSIPIILFGEQWKALLGWIKKYPLKDKLMDKDDLTNVFVAETSKDVIKIIKKAQEMHDDRDKCAKLSKYFP